MLTSDLALSWRRGDRVNPRYIKTDDANYLQEAEGLIAIFCENEGRRRAELNAELNEYVGFGTNYKIMRGLIKLLTDRCEFETRSAAGEPIEIRKTLFLAAKNFHPVNNENVKTEIIERVAQELNCSAQEVLESLYADLTDNQKLISFETLSPRELIDRYNLAQAQALLYRCLEMHLWIEPQRASDYREIFNAIKSFRLIHSIKGNAVNGYHITLTGPVSMFHRSQKYGVQMAVFLPALLNCKSWRMRAEIHSKERDNAFYELDSNQKLLRSHYDNTPEYENPVIEKLFANWRKLKSEWTLEANREVVDLGQTAFIPDLVLRHPNGKKVYLDVLGFWTPDSLKKRLREFESASGFCNFIIAAWEELRGSREDDVVPFSDNVIVFKRNLDATMVELTAEKITGNPS
jgi:uncharacterized protein